VALENGRIPNTERGAAKYETRWRFGVFFPENVLFSVKKHPKEYLRR